MEKQRIALVEFAGSHDECLLTQFEAVRSAGWETVFVTTQALYDRNPHLHPLCTTVYFVEPTGKAFADFLLMWKLVRFLKVERVSKIVFNTAQGGHVRNLALLLPKKIKGYGLIHTVRKFQGSFTQKIIHRAIKRYVVLSDDLLKRIQPPNRISVGSFYPVSFPHFNVLRDKPEGETWITITGGVENRRKDLETVLEFIADAPATMRFIFLGKTDLQHPDASAFLEALQHRGLLEKVRYFTQFVDHETFDGVLQQTDFLLPLIHPGTPSADQYINNQISGAFSLSFGYHIPLLIHAFYQTEADLQIAAHFYTPGTFTHNLEEALLAHDRIRYAIAHTEKWRKPFQWEHYLQFVEIESREL